MIEEAVDAILARLRQGVMGGSLLTGISGIDGCGKSYLNGQMVDKLNGAGMKAVGMNTDGWLNLPSVRFNEDHPAQHFYDHAIRFEEMFSQLVLPLKKNRSIDITADFAEETATKYRKHRYHYTDIDIIVVEGIYLFKNEFRDHFDIKIWIDCSYETALERAIARAQEGLSPAETVQAYQRIYFPAQQIHIATDHPRAHADFIIKNDFA